MRRFLQLICSVVIGIILTASFLARVSAQGSIYYLSAFVQIINEGPGVVTVTNTSKMLGPEDDDGALFTYTVQAYEAAYIEVDLGGLVSGTPTITVRGRSDPLWDSRNLFDRNNQTWVSPDGVTWYLVDAYTQWAPMGTTTYTWGNVVSVNPSYGAFRYIRLRFEPPWEFDHGGGQTGYIDAVKVGGITNVIWPPGGWPACDTVENADFDTSSSWTLSGGASITESVLSLPDGADAYQNFQAVATEYTATVVARRTGSYTNSGIILSFLGAEGGEDWGSALDSNWSTDWSTNVYSITMTGVGAAELYIEAFGDDFEIDYVCLQPWTSPSYGCTSSEWSTTFVDGYNECSGIFQTNCIGFSEDWVGINFPNDPLYDYQSYPAQWFAADGTGIMGSPGAAIGQKNLTAIKYSYLVIPHIITADVFYNDFQDTNQLVVLYISYDGTDWQRIESIPLNEGYGTILPGGLPGAIYGGKQERVVFDSLSIARPGYVALGLYGEPNAPFPSASWLHFNNVVMDACYGGPNSFSECVFGDPDFDTADGQPSRFFWPGTYTSGVGVAELPTGTFLSQGVTPPTAGAYDLTITTDDHSATCEWDVSFSYYNNPALGIADATLPCETAGADTFTATMSLPAYPMLFYLDQIAGTSSVSRICLTLASGTAGQCLNVNPDFLLGSLGYTGDFNTIAGRVTIPDGGKLAAAGVQYQASPPPYVLDVVLSPSAAATVTINHGNVPGYDPAVDASHEITQTATITYALYSDISGNFGPTLWNLGDGDLSISRYCIQPTTGITNPYPDPFICGALDNADFISGTTGWSSSNVIVVNGVASFAPGGYLSQNLGDLSDEPITTTIRWLVNAYAPTSATLEVASDYTPTIVSHDVTPGQPQFWEDSAVVSGTTIITISTASSGFELDFICLYPGGTCVGCIAPPLPPGETPGTIVIPPGGELAECIAPPMGLLPGNITDTLASVWPWGGSTTNFEVMMAYNTGWVRFIGCRLDGYVTWMQDEFWGESWRFGLGGDGLHAHLDNIIFLLATLNLLASLQAILLLLQTIGGLLSSIVEGIIDAGRALLYLFGILGLALAALLGLLILIASIVAIIWLLPQEFWVSFRNAVTGSSAVALPLPTSPDDPLYNILIGIQLVNQVAGATFIFPIVVIAIVVGSIGLIIWTIKQFSVQVV